MDRLEEREYHWMQTENKKRKQEDIWQTCFADGVADEEEK
jgi:hypothetical protein